MKVEEKKDRFPKWEEVSSDMSLEEFQLLHQFIGSKWDEEYNIEKLIGEASVIVPNQKALSKFFGVPEPQLSRIVHWAQVKEISVPLERITEIENRLEQMTEKLEETLLQVRTKRIKPTHEQALANHYAECDLQDMVILLEEADKQDDDAFYEHWDKLLKDSSTGELINALADVLQSDAEHAVTRFDEIFNALRGRAPFEQMYFDIQDMKKDIASNERLIRGGLKDADEDTDSKYAFLEKKLDRLVKFIKSKYQADAEVLDELMTK